MLSRALTPLAKLYAIGTKKRLSNTGYRASVPVICVGNINAGGTGKTPTCIALAQHLIGLGHDVHIVSRGYGGSLEGPVLVNEKSHKADEVGDEPLLMAAFTKVWVAKDRAQGVKAAEAAGAAIVLLDDGMQNPSVEKDATIVVVDASRGFGNGQVIPAGPLREPVSEGLKRGTILLSIGDDKSQLRFDETWGNDITIPHVRGVLQPLQMGMDWDGLRVLAFAGIGHPEKFFQTLRNEGAQLIHAEALGDHQPLTPALMSRLESDAAQYGAQLVTTEKDAVRLPRAFRMKVLTMPVRLEFSSWTALEEIFVEAGLK